ncbi:MAG: sulfite exporter TauE/SafE family protein [Deltaproteobacteria bacterium]|nr:MAG: sulfite exporter TauE/SafE family protein [Deltaproteobacteria bacterium]
MPVHGVVQLTSNTTRTLLLLRRVRWSIFAYYVGPAMIGVALGARWYVGSELPWFRPAVGVFILAYLATLVRQPRLGDLPEWTFAPLGLVVGSLASLIGATGPLIAPFFLRNDLEGEEVVGTKAAVQIATHVTKIPAFFLLGFDYVAQVPIMVPLMIAAVAGTYAGRRLLANLPKRAFRTVFVVVLVAISMNLIFG